MDKLYTFLKMFYSPLAGMREARERITPFGAATIAFAVYALYALYVQAPYIGGLSALKSPRLVFAFFRVTLDATHALLFLGLVFVPIVILVVNLLEQRGSLRVRVSQEYASLASAIFYAWAAASVLALVLFALLRASGIEQQFITDNLAQLVEAWQQTPEVAAQITPQLLTRTLAGMIHIAFFAVWATLAVHEVFRLSFGRTLLTIALSAVAMFVLTVFLYPVFSFLLGSPLLLIVLFIFFRSYFTDIARTQRARASFRQNLEAATLNPADASAHYNLGLLHLERKEHAEARERFARAVSIDAEEQDAHYQLGRISRIENKFAEAIEHFGQVVVRDPAHAQHEIWREIGATYLVAAQFEDARDALERFLDHRTTDPEGLYLMGRALAQLNRLREAREVMQRCIDAVRSAPAYKYRMEKRWLTEAESFLRSQA